MQKKHLQNILPLDCSPIEVYKMVLDGSLKQFPFGFWKHQNKYANAREVLQYYIEDIQCWSLEEAIKNINNKDLSKYKLKGMMCLLFNDSPYLALKNAYPNEIIKPWFFKPTPKYIWENDETVKEALNWLFFEELKYTEKDITSKLNTYSFKIVDFPSLLSIRFDNSPFKALNFLFPDKYKPWEMACVGNNFWKDENNIKSALNWLFFEKLKWSTETIVKNISSELFHNNSLSGLFAQFNEQPYKIIEFMYPGQFKPFHLKNVTRGYWSDDNNVKEALNWLFYTKLKWTNDEIKRNISTEVFVTNNLSGLFSKRFNSSVFKVLQFMFNNDIDPLKMKVVPRNYYCHSVIKKELENFFYKELNWTEEEIISNLTLTIFKGKPINKLFKYHFNSSCFSMVDYLYPNKYKPWELKNSPNKFWNDENNIKEALHWLFFEKLNLSLKEIKSNPKKYINPKIFKTFKLNSLYKTRFNANSQNVLNFLIDKNL